MGRAVFMAEFFGRPETSAELCFSITLNQYGSYLKSPISSVIIT